MLKLRKAAKSDAELLFDWRNDPSAYIFFLTSAPVEWEEHRAWLSKKLNDPRSHIWIAEQDSVPVGYVRAEPEDGEGLALSWGVAGEKRGQGIGKEMLAAALALPELSGQRLIATVKKENIASTRIAEALGFSRMIEKEGTIRFELRN